MPQCCLPWKCHSLAIVSDLKKEEDVDRAVAQRLEVTQSNKVFVFNVTGHEVKSKELKALPSHAPCSDLTILLGARSDEAWLRTFFMRLGDNEVASLTFKSANAAGKASLSDETFSVICNWVKNNGRKLRRISIRDYAYAGAQLMYLRSALTARNAQF